MNLNFYIENSNKKPCKQLKLTSDELKLLREILLFTIKLFSQYDKAKVLLAEGILKKIESEYS